MARAKRKTNIRWMMRFIKEIIDGESDRLNFDLDFNYHLIQRYDKMYDEVMLGLRKTKGINLKNFENKYGIKFENKYDINELIKSKELIIKKGYLYVNPKYLYIINDILIKIL